MKYTRHILTLCASIFLASTSVLAAPDRIPANEEEFRALGYMMADELVLGASTSISAPPDYGDNWQYFSLEGGGINAIIEAGRNAMLQFGLVETGTKQQLYLRGEVKDVEGDLTLRGHSYKDFVLTENGTYVPVTNDFQFAIATDFPIDMGGEVEGGFMFTINENGYYEEIFDLDYDEGGTRIYFPTEMAGKLYIKVWVDGNVYFYGPNGKRLNVPTVETGVSVSFADTLFYNDTNAYTEVDDNKKNPTIVLTVTESGEFWLGGNSPKRGPATQLKFVHMDYPVTLSKLGDNLFALEPGTYYYYLIWPKKISGGGGGPKGIAKP